jgi:predicted nucleic acid-binding protein
MITVDSNIWIYYLDPTTSEHRHVIDYLEDLITKETILTSTIIWLEVSYYLFRTSPVKKEKLTRTLSKLVRLSNMRVVDFDIGSYFDTVEVLGDFRRDRRTGLSIGGRDASIVAMMNKYNVKTIVTHDTDFLKLADKGVILVYDPIITSM